MTAVLLSDHEQLDLPTVVCQARTFFPVILRISFPLFYLSLFLFSFLQSSPSAREANRGKDKHTKKSRLFVAAVISTLAELICAPLFHRSPSRFSIYSIHPTVHTPACMHAKLGRVRVHVCVSVRPSVEKCLSIRRNVRLSAVHRFPGRRDLIRLIYQREKERKRACLDRQSLFFLLPRHKIAYFFFYFYCSPISNIGWRVF